MKSLACFARNNTVSASYGSLAQIRDMKRLAQIGEYTAIGASGDMSDWQQIQHLLDQLQVQEFNAGDEHALGPENIYEYLRY